jgi:hypothetical protein
MMQTLIDRRDAQAVAIMYDLHEKYNGGACEPLGTWLVSRAKRTWPRFAGFRGPSKTNVKRRWAVISYHHPAQLCWLWSVWFTLVPTDGHWWRLWGGYRHDVWFGMKYVFRVSIHRQPGYAWMLSGQAKARLKAIAQSLDDGATV